MTTQAKNTTSAHLGQDYDALMSQAVGAKGAAVSCEDMRNCFFGGYIDSSKGPEERTYAEVADVTGLISTMESYLVDHNGQNSLTIACSSSINRAMDVTSRCAYMSINDDCCSCSRFSMGPAKVLCKAQLGADRLHCNLQA